MAKLGFLLNNSRLGVIYTNINVQKKKKIRNNNSRMNKINNYTYTKVKPRLLDKGNYVIQFFTPKENNKYTLI